MKITKQALCVLEGCCQAFHLHLIGQRLCSFFNVFIFDTVEIRVTQFYISGEFK